MKQAKHSVSISLAISMGLINLLSCVHKPAIIEPVSNDNFPTEIGNIFTLKCATAGCHNLASYKNAGGLLLDNWEHLFDGGNNGAVVVPYSPDYSSLLYFVNTDSSKGVVATPTMPLNGTHLSAKEYNALKEWIEKGAPDKGGKIPFASSPESRQKIYMVHQGCDMMAVIDAAKNVVMRYVPLGEEPYPESPTYVQVSPNDGRYVFVSFWYSHKVYKIDAFTDTVVAKIDLGDSFWSTMHVSRNGENVLLSNPSSNGMIMVNAADRSIQDLGNVDMRNPNGIACNKGFDTFYITSLFGNTIYKISDGYFKEVSIDGKPLTTTSSATTPDPNGIIMSPDRRGCFLSCENSNEVRVIDIQADTLIKVIPVGIKPQGLAMSKNLPYLFITCMEDSTALSGYKGSVYVINYETLEVVKKIEGKFYQPHGISVNDKDGQIYIFNRNQNYGGPAPHHSGPCSGRNGYYIVYDLTTLAPVSNKRYEVLVDPFISDVRFK